MPENLQSGRTIFLKKFYSIIQFSMATCYRIHLIFFGLENPELSQFRVTERVTEGGHYVDPETLNNNFFGNLDKLNIYHPLIDDLTIVDTSEISHRILFKTVLQQVEFHVEREELPDWFTERLPAIVELFL